MNNTAREVILESIRSHLAASVPCDKQEISHGSAWTNTDQNPSSSVEICGQFKASLEAVDGYCLIVQGEDGIVQALNQITRGQHIAISDNPEVERLLHRTDLEIEELGIAPNAQDIFRFDTGISAVQAAIAETGTLVLDSACERHRLVSLVPPVHIAIVRASQIYRSLSEVLALIRKDKEISPAVTFITGPSRTADIELTLAIGVHGPQELYVIVDEVN